MKITARDTAQDTGDWSGQILVGLDTTTPAFHPQHITFRIEDAPWDVEGVIYTDTSGDGPKIVSLTITAHDGGQAISPDMIRGIKLGAARDEAIRQLSHRVKRVGDKLIPVDRPLPASTRPSRVARSRKGRRITDNDLTEASNAVRAAVAAGRTDITYAVAERLHLSTATAGRRIALARKRGILED